MPLLTFLHGDRIDDDYDDDGIEVDFLDLLKSFLWL
jgi:hypothetical protein